MFGPHVSRYHAAGKNATLADHIEAARLEAADGAGFRVSAAAVFVSGPRNRRITLAQAESADLRRYGAESGVQVIAHSAYVAYPWGSDRSAAQFIQLESATCQAAGISGLVVHLPKAPVATVVQYIDSLVNPVTPDVRIFLETPAVKPRESHYETPEKLAALFDAIDASSSFPDRFGLCIDTAHLWTCGIDLAARAPADDWLARLEARIPAERVMLHLNDSVNPLGVGPDEHAALGAGRIWSAYAGSPAGFAKSGLAAFVDYARRHDTVTILERKPKEALMGDYRALLALGAGGSSAEGPSASSSQSSATAA